MSTAFGCPFNSMGCFVCRGGVCSNSKRCLDYRLRSRGGVLSTSSASSVIVHRSGRQVLQYCLLARTATRDLFRAGALSRTEHAPTNVARVSSEASPHPRRVHAAIARLLNRTRKGELMTVWIAHVEI